MSNYNVNWDSFVEANTPTEKRQFYRMHWIKFLVSELKKLHAKFLAFKTDTLYKESHNGMKIYMLKVLNEQFDPINQEILISPLNVGDRMYLFLKPEAQTNYIYSKYDATTTYQVGEFAKSAGKVWICIQISTGNIPADPSLFWDEHKDSFYLYNQLEYLTIGFIVYVPVALVFDTPQLQAWVERYKLAGMPYTIQTYTP